MSLRESLLGCFVFTCVFNHLFIWLVANSLRPISLVLHSLNVSAQVT